MHYRALLENQLASMGQIKACIDQGEWVAVHSDVHEPPVNHVWVERAILLSSCPKRKKKTSAPASAEKGLESSEDVFIHQSLFCSSQGKKMTLRSSLTYTFWCLLYLVRSCLEDLLKGLKKQRKRVADLPAVQLGCCPFTSSFRQEEI